MNVNSTGVEMLHGYNKRSTTSGLALAAKWLNGIALDLRSAIYFRWNRLLYCNNNYKKNNNEECKEQPRPKWWE